LLLLGCPLVQRYYRDFGSSIVDFFSSIYVDIDQTCQFPLVLSHTRHNNVFSPFLHTSNYCLCNVLRRNSCQKVFDRCCWIMQNLIAFFCLRETKIDANLGLNEQQSPLESIPELSQVLHYPICQVSLTFFFMFNLIFFRSYDL
jgi:hypothetical protein